jgi:hypothetical protein
VSFGDQLENFELAGRKQVEVVPAFVSSFDQVAAEVRLG